MQFEKDMRFIGPTNLPVIAPPDHRRRDDLFNFPLLLQWTKYARARSCDFSSASLFFNRRYATTRRNGFWSPERRIWDRECYEFGASWIFHTQLCLEYVVCVEYRDSSPVCRESRSCATYGRRIAQTGWWRPWRHLGRTSSPWLVVQRVVIYSHEWVLHTAQSSNLSVTLALADNLSSYADKNPRISILKQRQWPS